jgi:hypothetical protein
MLNENQNNFNNSGDYKYPPDMPVSRGQKIAAMVLAVFALVVIVFWAIDFKKSINNSSYVATENQPAEQASNNSQAALTDEELKAKDTDKDGVNDWDELNVYRTSPYLEDTDSDNIMDGAEVSTGKDPNCPEGRSCYAVDKKETGDSALANPDAAANSQSGDLNNVINKLNQTSTTTPAPISAKIDSTNQTAVEELLSGNLEAAKLRETLTSLGMDAKMLGQFSDEELLKSYKDVLGSQNK